MLMLIMKFVCTKQETFFAVTISVLLSETLNHKRKKFRSNSARMAEEKTELVEIGRGEE